MKSKGKLVYLDVCDKIIIKVLDIQRQNHHLRNSRRTNSDHDVSVLIDNEIASSKSSIELERKQSAIHMESSGYSSFDSTGGNEAHQQLLADAVAVEIPPLEDFPIKEEPLGEVNDNSYRFYANTPTDTADECDPHVQPKTNDLEEQNDDSLKKKFLKLQIRNLQIVNYKEMLQVIKLERELGIARSKLPESFNFDL